MKPSKDLDEILANIQNEAYEQEGLSDSTVEEAKQQLLALIEQREREARIDELKSIYGELGHIKAVRNCIDERVADCGSERIEALKKGES